MIGCRQTSEVCYTVDCGILLRDLIHSRLTRYHYWARYRHRPDRHQTADLFSVLVDRVDYRSVHGDFYHDDRRSSYLRHYRLAVFHHVCYMNEDGAVDSDYMAMTRKSRTIHLVYLDFLDFVCHYSLTVLCYFEIRGVTDLYSLWQSAEIF